MSYLSIESVVESTISYPVSIMNIDWSTGLITLNSTINYEGDGISCLRLIMIENDNYIALGGPSACMESVTTDFKTGLLTCCAPGTTFQIHSTRFGWDSVSADTAVSELIIK